MPKVDIAQGVIDRLQQQVGMMSTQLALKDAQMEAIAEENNELRAMLEQAGLDAPVSIIQREGQSGSSDSQDTGAGSGGEAARETHQGRPPQRQLPGNGKGRGSQTKRATPEVGVA